MRPVLAFGSVRHLSVLIALTVLSACAPLRIGIIGDQTLAEPAQDLAASYAVLEKGVALLNAYRPRAVLLVGDLVESSLEPERITMDFLRATGILSQLEAPWYLTPGDHDVNPGSFVQNSTDRSREVLFQKLYSTLQPLVRDRLYYSFDIDGFHFIALYSVEHLHTDPRWGNVFLSGISDLQFQWLASDLERHRGARGIVVFTHQPLWYNWTKWERVHELLRQYRVRAVVAGHFHYPQQDTKLDGIQYVVIGTTGGVSKSASRSAGGLQAVYLMTLSGGRVDVEILPIGGGERFGSLKSRYDMDRVQAIDSILGSLKYVFTTDAEGKAMNQVFSEGGQLVVGCGSSEPAKLRLEHVGNPIDIPVRIEISIESDAANIGDFAFGADVCARAAKGMACDLKPNVNIAISNTSLVQLPGPPWGRRVLIWEGTLATKTPTGVSKVIALPVQMTFPSQTGDPLTVYGKAVTTIQDCPPSR